MSDTFLSQCVVVNFLWLGNCTSPLVNFSHPSSHYRWYWKCHPERSPCQICLVYFNLYCLYLLYYLANSNLGGHTEKTSGRNKYKQSLLSCLLDKLLCNSACLSVNMYLLILLYICKEKTLCFIFCSVD